MLYSFIDPNTWGSYYSAKVQAMQAQIEVYVASLYPHTMHCIASMPFSHLYKWRTLIKSQPSSEGVQRYWAATFTPDHKRKTAFANTVNTELSHPHLRTSSYMYMHICVWMYVHLTLTLMSSGI